MPSRKSVALSATCLALFGGLATLAAAGATTDSGAAVPYPSAQTPQAIDLGALETLSRTPITVTVVLSLQSPDAAEQLLKAVSTPSSPQYRQFLTPDQFAARFAPTKASVAKAIASFAKYNLTAEQATATTLHVTGQPADIERAFKVSLHSFQVSAHGEAPGYTFRAPVTGATLPAELSGLVSGVVGLDTRPALHPLNAHVLATLRQQKPAAVPGYTYNPPQELTVTDFAHLYDVEPLYSKGISGAGRTIAILSLANFTPSDAYAYWSALGLTVNPNRISVVYVDGGPGAPSDASGSIETTLDNEQSGGVAPGANIIDYLAPNTNQGFIDVFATAIEANIADTISISWGEWEWWDNATVSPVTDPLTGLTVGILQAVHEQLLRAGLQGESVFTAQGDGGAYESFHDLQGLGGCVVPYSLSQPYSCSETLTVGYPGSDTAITSGGGTTLAATLYFCLNAACTPPYYEVTIPNQRVWGWDYLKGLCSALGLNIYSCGIFPGGGGGGVSIEFSIPFYQLGLAGTQLSRPNQVYQAGTAFAFPNPTLEFTGVPLFYRLPAFFAGRNVPDVSFNADPETGYLIFYTSNVSGFAIYSGYGGTSFVAPQLNGVTSLLNQELGGRLGLLNFALYGATDSLRETAPLHPITTGDNWYYSGRNGYAPAAGLGVMDVANFAAYLNGLLP
jgi:kumamolisin